MDSATINTSTTTSHSVTTLIPTTHVSTQWTTFHKSNATLTTVDNHSVETLWTKKVIVQTTKIPESTTLWSATSTRKEVDAHSNNAAGTSNNIGNVYLIKTVSFSL